MKVACVAVLMFGLTILDTKSDAADTFTVLGVGNLSCGAFVAAKQQKETVSIAYTAFRSWLAGFVSAMNMWITERDVDILKGRDNDALEAWVEKWCRECPLERFNLAVQALSMELVAKAKSPK